MASVLIEHSPSRARSPRRRFYVGISLLMTAMVVVGFWPAYFGPLVRGAAVQPWIIHLHGAVYLGWMALLLVQSVLAARGRIATHRRVGSFGIAYACLVLILGVVVSFAAPAMHVAAGEWTMDDAATFLVIPLGDMVLFGGFFGAAVAYRRKPEIHKRLILLATVALLFAAVGRLNVATPITLLVWYLPVLAGMGYDLFTNRRIHPVYFIGAAIMGVWLARVPFGQSELWRGVGRAMLAGLV